MIALLVIIALIVSSKPKAPPAKPAVKPSKLRPPAPLVLTPAMPSSPIKVEPLAPEQPRVLLGGAKKAVIGGR